MVSVLLNWFYIFITVFLVGFAASKAIEKRFGWHMKTMDSILAAGIMLAAVYAQFFSLFYKVGLAANAMMLLACLCIVIVWHREIAERIKRALITTGVIKGIILAGLILIWSYCTSRGYMHYDSDLYHAQSIRWIEEYGVVKGLGNIHVRFAYNSSFFALSALYSMKFLTGQSLHTVNGFLALLLSAEVLRLFDIRERRKIIMADFARLGAFYYLTIIYRDIVAPASDYAIMCVIFYLVIKWLDLLETDRDEIAPFALLCVGGVYAVSLKLTAGLILLLLIKPAKMLIQRKRWKDIWIYLLMGAVILAPWLIRTVVISGYLIYPFPSLDLFDVDWKMNASAAALDAAEIQTWGRGLNNAALVDLPIREWFPGWFSTMLPTIGKLLIIADILCLVIFAAMMVWFLLRILVTSITKKNFGACLKQEPEEDQLCIFGEYVLVLAAVLASYLFWQLSAPLLRYGYAYVLLTALLTVGFMITLWQEKVFKRALKPFKWGFAALLFVFSAVKLWSLADYIVSVSEQPYALCQQDYGSYELECYEVNEVSFYYPVSGDRVGYQCFPAIPRKMEIVFRGEDIREGFMDAEGQR
ncbi:MAG: hypothetical protein J6C19_01035 [Lachnospiraceae bacterium]|nr:hypothetical protein [Lachnospiraceae bacterium]